jgi:regulator of protease activity HflC (stomatin/prohibitin superfamily)
MAEIRDYGILHHLRSEPTAHILRFRSGRLVASGAGLTFWFHPLSTALAEVPLDDRELPFLITARTLDFQEASIQGALTYRVADPARLARRLDFSIELSNGRYIQEPLEQLADLIIQFAQGFAMEYLNQTPLRQALAEGLSEVRERIAQGLQTSPELEALGVELVAVRLGGISPSTEMEKAE